MTSSHLPQAKSLYQQALEADRRNHPEEAVAKLRSALALMPDFEDAYEALAVILFNQQRYDEAIPVIEKWIGLNPESVMSHTNLSRCFAAKGMIAEAEKEQAEARRLTWKADLKEKRKAEPPPDYPERIARYRQVIALDPQDVLGYYSLGTVFAEAGKYREAADTFEQAIAVDPAHSASYLGLGLALEALGDRVKAGRTYQKGIEIASGRGDIIPLKKMEQRIRNLEDGSGKTPGGD